MDRIGRLEKTVQQLACADGRLPGSPGHVAARARLVERLSGLGIEGYCDGSYEAPYTADGVSFVNVLAQTRGKNEAADPLLLAAHYDTCGPFPGADDNAAAIAILLNVAERLQQEPAERPVILAFFDAEEPPYYLTPAMGSIHFYHHQRRSPIHCAIALDLCGHDVPLPGLEDLLFITGMESDPGWPGVLERCAPGVPIRLIPTLNRYIGDLSDHHVFRMHQRPYLFLSCGRWEHYHQPTDTPDRLNYEKTASIADLVFRMAVEAACVPLDGPFEGYDPIDTELLFIHKAVGPFLESLGFSPRNRGDLDMMVQTLVDQFGLCLAASPTARWAGPWLFAVSRASTTRW